MSLTSSDNHLLGKAIAIQGYEDLGRSNLVITDGHSLPWQQSFLNDRWTTVIQFSFGPGKRAGGEIVYTLEAVSSSGDSVQVMSGRISYAVLMTPEGVFNSSIDERSMKPRLTTSHRDLILKESWQIQDVVERAGYIRIRARFVSNIESTRMKLSYHIINNSSQNAYY